MVMLVNNHDECLLNYYDEVVGELYMYLCIYVVGELYMYMCIYVVGEFSYMKMLVKLLVNACTFIVVEYSR